MGAIIKGKEYRIAKCVKCSFEWRTDESDLNGIGQDGVDDFAKFGIIFSVGDDVCLNCCIELFEMEDKRASLKVASKT